MTNDPNRSVPPTIALGLGHDMVGVVIAGELTILRPLAEGGMGAVFVALQKSTGKERALKLMHREIAADPEFKRRFEQEAQVGARIRSEHVVEVLAAGVDGGQPREGVTGLPYLVMELLEGEDLRQRLARGPMSTTETRAVLEQLCHAMTAAHAAGVIHRDLKPENVFLARSRRAGAGPFTVKVLDFGIAKLVLESSTRATRGAVGSPLWMAPEQTSPGPVTAAADVWSLGLLTYEMLVGKSYWRTANRDGGNTLQLLREIVLEPLPSATERAAEYGLADRLPPGFDAWFARCIVREPTERFPNASVLWSMLPGALASAPSSLAVQSGSGGVREDVVEVLGATYVAPSASSPIASSSAAPPPSRLSDTGAATPFGSPSQSPQKAHAQAVSAPPFAVAQVPMPPSHRVPPETPLATVQDRDGTVGEGSRGGADKNSSGQQRRMIALGAITIAAVGVAIWSFTRSPQGSTTVGIPSPSGTVSVNPVATGPATTTSSGQEPGIAASAVPMTALTTSAQPTALAATTTTTTTTMPPTRSAIPTAVASEKTSSASTAAAGSASAVPQQKPRSAPGGFSDPTDRNGPVTWKVQDRHVRLFVRLVSNESNVADAVVRKAIEWSSWEYLRCYERLFGGAKDLPEGTLSVGFDILDQLPRHAKLVSSTFTSDAFNDCVVRTLVGQTINAAGPDGKGHAVEGFRFVPN